MTLPDGPTWTPTVGVTYVSMTELRTLRRNAGLTLKELAEGVGHHFQTVNRWQAGTRRPSGAARRMLAQVLGCSLEELDRALETKASA